MKELTIEQKAQRYDEAIKVIKDNLGALNEITETGANVVNIQSIRNCFYRAFPELKESKESKDERIRKELLQIAKESEDSFYMVMTPDKRKHLIAWLIYGGFFIW